MEDKRPLIKRYLFRLCAPYSYFLRLPSRIMPACAKIPTPHETLTFSTGHSPCIW